MKIKIHYLLVVIIIIGLIVTGIILFAGDDDSPDQSNEIANVDYDKLDEVVFNVRTARAFAGDLIKRTNANGMVRAAREIEVSSNINSVIEQIKIYEGKRVRRDDLLIKLDDREYRINLNEAEDKLVEARVEYYFLTKDSPIDTITNGAALEIQKALVKLESDRKNGLVGDSLYRQIKDSLDLKLIFSGGRRDELILNKSGINRAKNTKERALLNIEYTNITAPFDGVIGDLNLSVGQRVSAGESLFKLIDDSELLIDVGILESEIPIIEKGNQVEIVLSALPNEKFEGNVLMISPFIDPETRTCKVTVKIDNSSSKIKPGMFATVNVQSGVLNNRLLVNKDALLVRDKRNLVFTVENGLAQWKYIELGDQNDKYIEVKNGINPGDEVIIQGHYTLAHDAKVHVID